jgi:hypothetical protein
MPADYDALLTELRGIRATLDRIAASVVSDQARHDLLGGPVWSCGHRHDSRSAALACARTAQAISAPTG